jgi:hypothetical protein
MRWGVPGRVDGHSVRLCAKEMEALLAAECMA